MIIFKPKILRLLTFVVVLSTALLISSVLYSESQSKNQVETIVLDAGHGGKDSGAVGRYSYEKDINLQVVLRLGNILKAKFPNKRILYTRRDDSYPKLKERHAMANRANGDLFISVHVNSSSSKSTSRRGTESYVLGLHRNDQKEDAIVEYKDMIVDENAMLDPTSPLTSIIIAQYSQAYLTRSINLASYIEAQFVSQGRRSEGVKQKGLEVLAGSAMPGVLVEIGFINNPEDESYLNTEYGRNQAASAIAKGIEQYMGDLNNNKLRK